MKKKIKKNKLNMINKMKNNKKITNIGYLNIILLIKHLIYKLQKFLI